MEKRWDFFENCYWDETYITCAIIIFHLLNVLVFLRYILSNSSSLRSCNDICIIKWSQRFTIEKTFPWEIVCCDITVVPHFVGNRESWKNSIALRLLPISVPFHLLRCDSIIIDVLYFWISLQKVNENHLRKNDYVWGKKIENNPFLIETSCVIILLQFYNVCTSFSISTLVSSSIDENIPLIERKWLLSSRLIIFFFIFFSSGYTVG